MVAVEHVRRCRMGVRTTLLIDECVHYVSCVAVPDAISDAFAAAGDCFLFIFGYHFRFLGRGCALLNASPLHKNCSRKS
ncbi:unnamed protein product [Periconia digitata]|uniref:Uncharacterized protein n=1 Tax=Periconia digitata TaxID=1303443 RepID=A0A9W4UMB2_9PLEO|nr:unnamed protein product [Periconia digitata]